MLLQETETNTFSFNKIGIIGLGLIGGSLAHALKARAGVTHIVAADTDTRLTEKIVNTNAVDTFFTISEDATAEELECFNGCDVVFVCTHPSVAHEIIPKLAALDVGIVTDTCSVKEAIMRTAEALPNFIGGHPMAGCAEANGFESATEALFEDSAYILCVPGNCKLPRERIEAFEGLLTAMGAKTTRMLPDFHDKNVAITSHLPHVIATALSELVALRESPDLYSLIGNGFKTTTHIASASPELWADIMLASSEKLSAAILEYINKLAEIRSMLQHREVKALKTSLTTAADFRNSLSYTRRRGKAAAQATRSNKMSHFGLIGYRLTHSMSPMVQRRIMELSGINGTYEVFDIHPDIFYHEIPNLMKSLDGFNCTIPYKEKVLPIMDNVHISARNCGAANTIFKNTGYNTDISGFRTSGIVVADKDVLLLGAGGTSRMMAFESILCGARSLTICARNRDKAQKLVSELKARFPSDSLRTVPYAAAYDGILKADVILNGTPLGMWPEIGKLPCGTALLHQDVEIFDAIYNPSPTRLVLNARKHGAKAHGGLRMLLRQAIEAQRIWNPNVDFDISELERVILPEMFNEQIKTFPVKFLITGFMGVGKTTISERLAKALNVEFLDLDREIEEYCGCSVNEIFTKSGEHEFRKAESLVAEGLLRRDTTAVVAAGGGIILSEENQQMIRKTNTLVLNLDAPFETAWERIAGDTTERPLLITNGTDDASRRDYARSVYDERKRAYFDFCDYSFDAAKSEDDIVADIVSVLTEVD